MKTNRLFRNKILEILENESFTDEYLFDKISELLSQNESILLNNLTEPKVFQELMSNSLSKLKTQRTDGNIKSKISSLDDLTGGFNWGEFVLIGARPGMGKSKFLQYLMIESARNHPVLYFDFDSGKENFIHGLISTLTEIPFSDIKNQHITNDQWKIIDRISDDIIKLPIYVSDETNKSMYSFRLLCKKYIDEFGVRIIFIDFLQLMGSNRYRHQRELEMGYISRELKNLARENNICIIASCQVSRNCEYRGGARRPILSDLRESGSFEQNADKILFLYRPEYYGFEMDENGDCTKNLMEIIVAKNRNGYIGRATVKHNLPYGGIVPFTPLDSRIEFSVNRLSELDEGEPPF